MKKNNGQSSLFNFGVTKMKKKNRKRKSIKLIQDNMTIKNDVQTQPKVNNINNRIVWQFFIWFWIVYLLSISNIDDAKKYDF